MPRPENEASFHSTVMRSDLEELNDVVSGVLLGFCEDAVDLSQAIKVKFAFVTDSRSTTCALQ